MSVIVPTFNEAGNIAEVIDRVHGALRASPHEVIVVDDDSPDRTWQVAQRCADGNPWVRVIRRRGCRGLASAVLDGMAVSTGDALAVIDGDLQHDETALPTMVSRVLHEGVDLCVGTRRSADGSSGTRSLSRRLVTGAGTAIAKRLLPGLRRSSDPLSGFFVVSRALYERSDAEACAGLRSYKVLWPFLVGDCPSVSEVGFCFRERAAGRTKLSAGVLVDDLAVALALRLGGVSAVSVRRGLLAGAAVAAVSCMAAAGLILAFAGL